MRKNCVADIVLALTGLVLFAAGCTTTMPKSVSVPVYSPDVSQQAVYSGTLALADFQREHVAAGVEQRPADYRGARAQLAQALATLRPSPLAPGAPAYSQHAIAFETALAAMDRIMVAEQKQDLESASIGWEMLDQSARALVPVLAGQN